MTRSLPAVPAHSVRWGPSDAVLVLLGTQLLSIVWAGVIITSFGVDPAVEDPVVGEPLPIAIGVLANVGLWIGYGLGPVLVARAKGRGPVVDYGARTQPSDLPLGFVLGAATQVALLPLLYWPILRFVDGDPSDAARELIDNLDGTFDWLLFTLSVAVIAPLVEELFYRGLLLRALQCRLGAVPAVLISSAVFAIVHRQLLPLPGLFLFGVIASLLTVWFGRLGPAIALHVGFNSATLLVLGFGA